MRLQNKRKIITESTSCTVTKFIKGNKLLSRMSEMKGISEYQVIK